MKNTTCSDIQGAMYAFPRIHLTKSAIKEAEKRKVEPDFLYCLDMVNETGIMTVPGSGFVQKDGEYHFRITNLVCPTEKMQETLDRLVEFNKKFYEKYA
jgi:aspartate/methionine/tyrosine aminotransferase